MPEVELPAGTIAYEDTGGEGPAVVLLHGLMMDGTVWRQVVDDLRSDYRCLLPTLPLGGHRRPMREDADLSMRGIAEIAGDFIARLDLDGVTLAMNDWGGGQLLIGGAHDRRIARLALCSCEAFDNVPPKGAARALPYIARVPGGIGAALLPFRSHRLRRLPMTFGHMSKRPVPREVMDRWFEPALQQREIRRDLRKYVLSSAQGRRDLLAAARVAAVVRSPSARGMGRRGPAHAPCARTPAGGAAAQRDAGRDRGLLHPDSRGSAGGARRAHARAAVPLRCAEASGSVRGDARARAILRPA